MSDDERAHVVPLIAVDPMAGAIISGCGGARKLRVKKAGTGKSGSYRVITCYAGGDEARARSATVDVQAVRAATNLTQGAFAKAYSFPIGTLRDWEQRRRFPDAGSATLLKMIQIDPKGVETIIAKVR